MYALEIASTTSVSGKPQSMKRRKVKVVMPSRATSPATTRLAEAPKGHGACEGIADASPERHASISQREDRHDGEGHPWVQGVLQLVQGRLQLVGGVVERVQGRLALLVAEHVLTFLAGPLEAVEDVPAAVEERPGVDEGDRGHR